MGTYLCHPKYPRALGTATGGQVWEEPSTEKVQELQMLPSSAVSLFEVWNEFKLQLGATLIIMKCSNVGIFGPN